MLNNLDKSCLSKDLIIKLKDLIKNFIIYNSKNQLKSIYYCEIYQSRYLRIKLLLR